MPFSDYLLTMVGERSQQMIQTSQKFPASLASLVMDEIQTELSRHHEPTQPTQRPSVYDPTSPTVLQWHDIFPHLQTFIGILGPNHPRQLTELTELRCLLLASGFCGSEKCPNSLQIKAISWGNVDQVLSQILNFMV